MRERNSLEGKCRKILEDNGGFVADKARTILLHDRALKNLRPPLEFISKNWRDPLTPALINLSCEAVGGQPDETNELALAMSLMNLSFYIWDDVVDNAQFKSLKPTLFGKFGQSLALIIGGLASAKAFSIAQQTELKKQKRQRINQLFWKLWVDMSQAEAISLGVRNQTSSLMKLAKIRKEANSYVGTCMQLGAAMGDCPKNIVKHLETYGKCLGIVLELQKDFLVSINLTLELAEKIRSGAIPYSLLWAREHSEMVRRNLEDIASAKTIQPSDIRQIVESTLEARTLDHTLKEIKTYALDAEKELVELNKSKATEALIFFVRAQPELFVRNLPTFKLRNRSNCC